MDNRDIEKIKIEYTDGTEVAFKKGFVAEIVEGNEDATVTFHMAGMGGKDLFMLVESVVQLGDRLGMFNGLREEDA